MKNVKLIFIMAIAALSSTSCLVDDEAEQLGGGDTTIVGFPTNNVTPGFVTNGEDQPYSVPVNVVGGNQGLIPDSDITVSYEIDPTSTAEAGVQFDLAGPQSVTIPAGATTVSIPLTIHSGELDSDAEAVDPFIILKITTVTSSQNVIVGTNYQTIKITLNGLCFSDLAGEYHINYASGAVAHITVTEDAAGAYTSNTTPGYLETAGYWMTFTDNCGVLTITEWYGSAVGYPISGTGTVAENGNLMWTGVTIQGIYENRNYTMIKD